MATSADIGTKLADERAAFAVWLDQHKSEDGGYKQANEFLTEFNTRNETLATMQASYEAALNVEKAASENAAKMGTQGRLVTPTTEAPTKSITDPDQLEYAVKSAMAPHRETLQELSTGSLAKGNRVRFQLPIGLKTIVALSDHYAQAYRAQTTGSALYFNSVEDLFLSGNVNTNNVEYFVQTTDTDNAAFVAENTAATDSYFTWTKTTDEIEDVQTWIPISRDMVNDEPFMLSTIQGMLAARLSKVISKELMYGTGSTPHLWGVTVRSGFQTQAKGTDPAFDALLKAATLVAVGGDATPSAYVIHPTDWQNLLLTRTVDGIYILGNPGSMPANPSLWGIPVRVSTTVAASAGTAAVGDFRTMNQVFYNGGLIVETSTEHSTYFTERKMALSLTQRLGIVSYRPSATTKITGL